MSEPQPTGIFDMSSEAIDQRLRDVAQLYRLGMSIKDITCLGKAKDVLVSTPVERPAESQNKESDTREKND